jgi:hypothetical protein
MNSHQLQRGLGLGLGAVILTGLTMAVSYHALAQGQKGAEGAQTAANRRPRRAAQASQLAQFRPQQPGQPPNGGPDDQGFGPPPMGPPMGGPPAMTATQNSVYVLRGNTLYALDARTLKITAQADLPMPQRGPGGADNGGFRPNRRPGAPGGDQQ